MKPNIIFLLIDSARADFFSCYGYPKTTTPFMDSFAQSGVLFENAISPSGSTKPTMYCIFTGMHLSKVGNPATLNPNYPSMAEILRDAGYHTCGISHNPWVSSVTNTDRGFNDFWFWNRANLLRLAGPKTVARKVVARKMLHEDICIENILAKKWLKKHRSNHPFFLYIHYGDLHHPYNPPKSILKKLLDDDITLDDIDQTNKNAHDFLLHDPDSISDKTVRILRNLYEGEIAYEDLQIQDLIDFVDSNGLLKDTLIVVTADHGDNIGEDGLFSHKFVLTEPIIRVPLILHLPGYFNNGRRSTQLAQTIDILPTIMELAQMKRPEVLDEIQGHSLVNLKNNGRDIAISERMFSAMSKAAKLFVKRRFPDCDLDTFMHHILAMRGRTEKYIWSSLGHHELYDLSLDPNEKENLYHKRPDSVSRFEKQLEDWRSTFSPYTIMAEEKLGDFDNDMIEQLRTLGYLD